MELVPVGRVAIRNLIFAMPSRAIVRIVEFCVRSAPLVVLAGTILMCAAAAFAVARFSINADVESLI
jgi:hypothetical protein